MNMLITAKKLQFRAALSFTLFALTGGILSVAASCGTETGNPIIKRPTTPRNVAQDTIESELVDLSESLIDSGNEDILNLASASRPLPLTSDSDDDRLGLSESKTCTSDGTSVKTSHEKNKESTRQFKKKKITVSLSHSRKIDTEWTSPSGAVKCTDGVLKKTLRSLKGTTEVRTGKVKRSLSRTGTADSGTNSEYSSASFESQGSWTTGYSDITIDADSLTVQKTIGWNLKKSVFISSGEGESSSEASSSTLEGSPLQVKIKRSRPKATIISKTIESGSTKTVRPDGIIIEITFSQLVFQNSDDCYPSSGKLSGKITPAPASGLSQDSFEIDFSDVSEEVPQIVFADLKKIQLSGACSANE